jgi:hypothetical protein
VNSLPTKVNVVPVSYKTTAVLLIINSGKSIVSDKGMEKSTLKEIYPLPFQE